eukprot:gnl/MRDRNA2_/MRDRNA2_117990_c0_seq1.p1 gnl/MRDRNA2_/MRDRNA2_117990_c0~~gnl/MRDRNA2_/MRDRNA2_117990_c0_seq1.p1  ORF type:complete len:1018 (-),score=196.38 gnl/MRDRNA2_/MRDRNA2_117990_c0_seq1:43-3096(-)
MAPSWFRYGQAKKRGFAPKGSQQNHTLHGIVFTDSSTPAGDAKTAIPRQKKNRGTGPKPQSREIAENSTAESQIGVNSQDLSADLEHKVFSLAASEATEDDDHIHTDDSLCLGSTSSTIASESQIPTSKSNPINAKGRSGTGLVHQHGIHELQPFTYHNTEMYSKPCTVQSLKRAIHDKVLAQEEKVLALASELPEDEIPRSTEISNLYNGEQLAGASMFGNQKFLQSPHQKESRVVSPVSNIRSAPTVSSVSIPKNLAVPHSPKAQEKAPGKKALQSLRDNLNQGIVSLAANGKDCMETHSPAPPPIPLGSSSTEPPPLLPSDLEPASGWTRTQSNCSSGLKNPIRQSLAEQWDGMFGLDGSHAHAASPATPKDPINFDKKKMCEGQMQKKKNFWSWMLHAAQCAADFGDSSSKAVALGRGLRNSTCKEHSSSQKKGSPRSGFLQRQRDFRRESELTNPQERKTVARSTLLKQFGAFANFNNKAGCGDSAEDDHQRVNQSPGPSPGQSARSANDDLSESMNFVGERRKCVVSKLMVNKGEGSIGVSGVASWGRTLDKVSPIMGPHMQAHPSSESNSAGRASFKLEKRSSQAHTNALAAGGTMDIECKSSMDFGRRASQARAVSRASVAPAEAPDGQTPTSVQLRRRKSMSHVLTRDSGAVGEAQLHSSSMSRGRRKSLSHAKLTQYAERKEHRPSVLFVDLEPEDFKPGEFSGCPETAKDKLEKDIVGVISEKSEKPIRAPRSTPKLLDRIRADNERAKQAQERHEKAITDALLQMQSKGRERFVNRGSVNGSNGTKEVKSFQQMSQEFHLPLEEIKFAKNFFDKYDADKSGTISESEFRKMLVEIANVESEDVLSEDFFQMGWVRANTDQTEEIDFEKFIHWFSLHGFLEDLLLPAEQRETREVARKYGLSVVEVEQLKQTFDSYDEDGSGRIEFHEFKTMLHALMKIPKGLELPGIRLRQFWQEIDEDKGGDVDFEEFLCWYLRYFSLDGNPDTCPVEEFYRNVRQLSPNKIHQ